MAKKETKEVKEPTVFGFTGNPKDRLEGPEFEELKESIRVKGVLMPILVRMLNPLQMEVVAGTRRYFAARSVGIAHADIPMRIVEMTDDEAREANIIENLQRKDVHPIDEAEAYMTLIQKSKGKLDAAEIAAKVGKSLTYVKGRLALAQLDEKIGAKVRAGEFPIAHAGIIARLPKAEQAKVFKWAMDHEADLSDLRNYVQQEVLKKAMQNPPWKNDAAARAEIAKVVGVEGTEKNLFGETLAETFDDPAQHARAMAAWLTMKIDEFKKAGKPLTLIAGDYRTTTKGVLGKSEYDTGAGHYASKKVKCISGHDALVVEGDGIGTLMKICTDKKCRAHHYFSETERATATPEEAKKQRAKRKTELQAKRTKDANENAKIAAALKKIKWPMNEAQLDQLLRITLEHVGTSLTQPICKRHGLEPDRKEQGSGKYKYTVKNYHDPLKREAIAAGNDGKIRLVFELLAGAGYVTTPTIIKRLTK